MTLNDLQQILFQHRDVAYADFSAKLIPTVPREIMLHVPFPIPSYDLLRLSFPMLS